jgi:tRNA nucleotidyltransferase (CCA-adding enzyme)
LLDHAKELDLFEAYAFKPIVTGKDLASALSTNPGPWMGQALDVVMAWQLLHPEITDHTVIIEALNPKLQGLATSLTPGKQRSSGETLIANLAHHFLSLTIRPLFAKAPKPQGITSLGREKTVESLPQRFSGLSMEDPEIYRLWKLPKHSYALDILKWALSALPPRDVEKNWPLLVPPILTMMDEIDLTWKSKAVELLHLLLKATPPALLAKTGLGSVFEKELSHCLTFLPSLTEDQDSILILNAAYPALLTLCEKRYPVPPTAKTRGPPLSEHDRSILEQRERYLDKLIRNGIVRSIFFAGEHVKVAELLLIHLRSITALLKVASVKHLKELLPLHSKILSEPLGPAYPPLLVAAANSLQTIILNAWPRIARHRGEVLNGVCVCWVRLAEEPDERALELAEVKIQLRTVVEILVAVLRNENDFLKEHPDEGQVIDFETEFKAIIDADDRTAELLRPVEFLEKIDVSI